nr:KTSC domain-containing protein [Lonsdalea britannica]
MLHIQQGVTNLQRKRVSSADLFAVGYDAETSILEIEFLNGSLYQYQGVARMIYEELLASNSKGSYYSRFIKNSFPYEKLQ